MKRHHDFHENKFNLEENLGLTIFTTANVRYNRVKKGFEEYFTW
jgi:hypothetical protein